MNSIEVIGGTSRQQELVKSMVEYCIDKLLPRYRTLDIVVHLKKVHDAKGYCCSLDKRTFEIEVDRNMRQRPLLETVAHEMVHVKQYAKGELTEGKWQGKLINPDEDYWDRGYEIEAHGREIGLFIRWAQNCDHTLSTPGTWMLEKN